LHDARRQAQRLEADTLLNEEVSRLRLQDAMQTVEVARLRSLNIANENHILQLAAQVPNPKEDRASGGASRKKRKSGGASHEKDNMGGGLLPGVQMQDARTGGPRRRSQLGDD